MKAGTAAALAGGVLAAGVVGAVALSWDSLITPLVPQDDGETNGDEPNRDNADDDLSELVEPLVPTGGNRAPRFRVLITYSSRLDMQIALPLAVMHEGWVESEDRFEGEVRRTADDRWEGELTGTAEGEDFVAATAIGIGDYTCGGTWEAHQPVELTLEILEDESAIARMVDDPDPGGVYVSVSLQSTGTVDYVDPVDPCDPAGAESDSELIVPLVPEASDRFAPFGAYACIHDGTCNLAAMLPPPGFGKLIERIDRSLQSMGWTEEWVIELEALD